MRWKSRNDTEWHRWFAWYPVLTEENEWVWLEWVNRQHRWLANLDDPWWYYSDFDKP